MSGNSNSVDYKSMMPLTVKNLRNQHIPYSQAEAILVHWVSPYEFYVQLNSYKDGFKMMTKEVEMFYNDRLPEPFNYYSDILVAVFDEKRQEYIRGRIVSTNRKDVDDLLHATVKSLDYGDEIVCQKEHIHKLATEFVTLPPMAIKCSLRGISQKHSTDDITEHATEFIVPLQIECEFVKTVEGTCYVEALVDGQNLRDSLILKGNVLPLPRDFEYHLIINQVLLMRLSWISDLSDFRAQLMDLSLDTTLPCCFFKVKKYDPERQTKLYAAMHKLYDEFSPRFKELYESKIIFARIADVTSDKILLLELYIPELPVRARSSSFNYCLAYYPVLCAYECKVSHVLCDSNIAVYVQSVEHNRKMEDFAKDMNDFYRDKGDPLCSDKVYVGIICAALASNGNYYRGKMCEDYKSDTYLIEFIDHGNREEINLKNLKNLDEKHRFQCAFAIKTYMDIQRSPNVNKSKLESEILRLTADSNILQANVTEALCGTWIIDILVTKDETKESLSSYLKKNELARTICPDLLRERIDMDMN